MKLLPNWYKPCFSACIPHHLNPKILKIHHLRSDVPLVTHISVRPARDDWCRNRQRALPIINSKKFGPYRTVTDTTTTRSRTERESDLQLLLLAIHPSPAFPEFTVQFSWDCSVRFALFFAFFPPFLWMFVVLLLRRSVCLISWNHGRFAAFCPTHSLLFLPGRSFRLSFEGRLSCNG